MKIKKEKITERIHSLRTAIAYSRHKKKIMSHYDGMMCHREIAAWFRVLDNEMEKPCFVVSTLINEKVEQITKETKETNWIKPKEIN